MCIGSFVDAENSAVGVRSSNALMKTGIFGGTFNPPHIGHMIVAEHVRTELSLDRIIFAPAAIPPHKTHQGIIPAEHRIAMLRLTLKDNPHFELSEIEIQRGGVSFTVDTLREIKSRHPLYELFLLIGMDNLAEFKTWKSPESILQLATVVAMTRPGVSAESVPPEMKDRVKVCPVPAIEISSRDLRAHVRDGKSIRYFVADSVAEYIRAHNLYAAEFSP